MTAWTLQALLELRVEVNVVRKGYSGRSPARTTWCTFWVMQGMKAIRIICFCGRFVVSCQRMTSCRIWLEIAILRRSEETCQAREFIVLSVEQSVRGQIVCGHLPVQKIAWVPACAAECCHMEHVHITWKGKPWRTTSTSMKWTKFRKVGVEEWPSRAKGAASEANLHTCGRNGAATTETLRSPQLSTMGKDSVQGKTWGRYASKCGGRKFALGIHLDGTLTTSLATRFRVVRKSQVLHRGLDMVHKARECRHASISAISPAWENDFLHCPIPFSPAFALRQINELDGSNHLSGPQGGKIQAAANALLRTEQDDRLLVRSSAERTSKIYGQRGSIDVAHVLDKLEMVSRSTRRPAVLG